MPSAVRYSRISVEEGMLAEKLSQEDGVCSLHDHHGSMRPTWLQRLTYVLLGCSLLMNGITLYRFLDSSRSDAVQGVGGASPAGLDWNNLTEIRDDSIFGYEDRESQDKAWSSDLINPANYAVALDDTYVATNHLLRSMRWPWDHKKGIYLTQSGHQFHCLHVLRDSVNNAHYQEPMAWPYHHQVHCLSILIDDVICSADDMLLYNGHLNANAKGHLTGAAARAGLGTPRVCRDIHKLLAWSKDHSACYSVDASLAHGPEHREEDRYRFCPDGSKPWEAVDL